MFDTLTVCEKDVLRATTKWPLGPATCLQAFPDSRFAQTRHAFVEVIPKAAKIIKSNIKYKTGPPCTGDQRAKIALAMTTLENPREKLGHP